MLVISGRAYKRKLIFCLTLFVLLVTLLLSPEPYRHTAASASLSSFDKWLMSAVFHVKYLVVWVYAAMTLLIGLSMRHPYLVADEMGFHAQMSLCGGVKRVGWDEIGRTNVAVIEGPDVLWRRSSRWQSRTLLLYPVDPAYHARQGWRGQLSLDGAAFAISESMVGSQFDELLALVNARVCKPT